MQKIKYDFMVIKKEIRLIYANQFDNGNFLIYQRLNGCIIIFLINGKYLQDDILLPYICISVFQKYAACIN